MAGAEMRKPLRDLVEAVEEIARTAESEDGSVTVTQVAATLRLSDPFLTCFGTLATFALNEMKTKAEKFEEASESVETVQELVDRDIRMGCERRSDSLSRNLIRMKRGAELISLFFDQILTTRGNSVSVPLRTAYNQLLAPYHGRSLRDTLSALLESLPTKDQLLQSFGEDENSAAVLMQNFVTASNSVVPFVERIFSATDQGRELLRMV